MVVFFTTGSYLYMESIMSMWQGMGILYEVWKYKLFLIETLDSQETSLALEIYRTACCNGRGTVMLYVARGKVSEGTDFDQPRLVPHRQLIALAPLHQQPIQPYPPLQSTPPNEPKSRTLHCPDPNR